MTVSPEELMAYADGELGEADVARVESALAADPALQAQVEKHRALRASLSAAYEPILEEPVPARLTGAARRDAGVVHLSAARAKRVAPTGWLVREWAAIAAALVVGVIVGGRMLGGDGLVTTANDGLVARGVLARALDGQLAAESGPVRIGLSFRTADSRACRTFAADNGALNGLACRDGSEWRIDMTMRGEARVRTDFRTAAAETPAPILERAEALMAGDPLDAAAERAARDTGWK